MPRSRSSGALSIWSKATYVVAALALASTLVIAAVNVVLPWSMCPIVPTFTCGFVRSYFAFAIMWPPTARLAGSGPSRRLAGDFGHDLVGDRGRDFLVARELHRVGSASLRHRPHFRCVSEHLPQRYGRADDLRAAARLHRDDPTAAAVQVSDDGAHVFLGRHDLDVHHRLEQHRLGPAAGFLEPHRGGDLECHPRRVHVVI